MLANVRSNLDSFFVKLLLGLLVAAFAVWGVGPTMFAGNTNIVAKVGNEEIDRVKYELAVRRQARNLQAQAQLAMSESDVIKNYRIDQRVLAEMMVQAAYRANAADLGMRPSKEVISDELRNIESFQMGGQFSKQAMDNYLNSLRITYSELEDDISDTVLRNQISDVLFAYQPKATKLAETLYSYDNELRDATIITITRSDILDFEPVTEEDVATAYEKGKAGYKTDELRTYQYVLLSPEAFKTGLEASDEEIKSLYDTKAGEYIIPEIRTFNHISFSTEEDALAFITSVTSGADFVTAATQATEFSADEISIGEFSKEALGQSYSEAAAEAAFAVSENALSAPVASLAGFDVFQATSITAGSTTTLDSVSETLKAEIIQDKAVRAMYDRTNELEDEIATGLSFDELVEKFSLTVASIENTNRFGRDSADQPAVATMEGYVILRDAFELETDEDPELRDLRPGDAEQGMYIVRVTDIQPEREKTLEEMTETLTATLTDDRKMEKAGELIEQAMERLQKNEDPQDIINETGGTSFKTRFIQRTADEKSNLAQNIRDLLFSLPVGEINVERTADNTGYVVVKNEMIRTADLSKRTEKFDEYRKQLAEAITLDIATQYQTNLFKRFPETINNALIQQIFSDQNQ
ncbi:SurA N-terminal domain-containing protein [Temperatibacter marinus]|uniref:Parvulin-like PPIase n=1 Tax=Temperatibacter marinus TaxID=1456591 RepID=A0AA52EH11_9PROT|nr:SurA N-terminal domain-containing protein [Temperatibacter marinus]WND02367.1 SurA N-terminal domain-containing protein [Temperatibacter marinus]